LSRAKRNTKCCKDVVNKNFLALPKEKGLPNLKKFEQSRSRDIDIYSATIGPAIIEI